MRLCGCMGDETERLKVQEFEYATKMARLLIQYEETKDKTFEIIRHLCDLLVHPVTNELIYDRFYQVLDKAINGCELSHKVMILIFSGKSKYLGELPSTLEVYIKNELTNPSLKKRVSLKIAGEFGKKRIIRFLIYQITKRTSLTVSRNEATDKYSACDVIANIHGDYFEQKSFKYDTARKIWDERNGGDSFALWKKLGFDFEKPVEDDPLWRERFFLNEEMMRKFPPHLPGVI